MSFLLKKSYQLESSRKLPHLPHEHPCANLHGHSFKVTLCLKGNLSNTEGWVIDYAEIDNAFQPLQKKLDHRLLNEVEGLSNPTTENLCKYIYNQIRSVLPQLSHVEIAETTDTLCVYPA